MECKEYTILGLGYGYSEVGYTEYFSLYVFK